MRTTYYKVSGSDGTYIEDNYNCEKLGVSKKQTVEEKVEEFKLYLRELGLPSSVDLFIDGKRILF